MKHVRNLSEVLLGEHTAHIPLDMRQPCLQSGVQMPSDGLAHHGVLPHQHHRLPGAGRVDLRYLLGAHLVCSLSDAFWTVI